MNQHSDSQAPLQANQPVIPVILCGGAGTRLWPLSRKHFPKPFLQVGQSSLIAQTIERAAAVAQATGGQNLLMVSNESYEFLLRDECQPVLKRVAPGLQLHQLLEPAGRNTAPAIALAALWAMHTSAPVNTTDPVLLVLPADHLINPLPDFVQTALQAVQSAQAGHLTCFGMHPATPETGFGYIRKGKSLPSGAFEVQKFVEKPNRETALSYLASGEYLWNGGMFALQLSTLLAELKAQAPDVMAAAEAVWGSASHSADSHSYKFDKALFASLPDISIDYALMEKSAKVAVVPAHFQWSDIGSFAAMAEQCQADANGNSHQSVSAGAGLNQGALNERSIGQRSIGQGSIGQGSIGQGSISQGRGAPALAPSPGLAPAVPAGLIQVDTRNTHVSLSDRTVATLGVDNLLIIDTPDALLVAHRDRHQDVKKVVDQLKQSNSSLTDLHPTVHRPWGTYTVLEDGRGYKIKRIEVKQGASLSLQMHHHRSEHWIVVSGTAEVTNGDEVFLVRKNESTYIPAGNRHRLKNPGVLPLVMIEVQSGDYLEEDDIVRFDDVYGRAG